jgi:effector-binding domain-containing protein
MKKFFKFLGILLLILVIVVIVLGLIAPKDVKVERSETVNTPKEVVFEQIVKFKNWPHWSPWYKMEPTVEMTYNGTDGEVGSGYSWKGKKTGSGEMKNSGVNGTDMNYDLMFKEPFENKASGSFTVADAGNGQSKVTWILNSHSPFPWNAMNIFMDMDKMIGKDFENGLKDMKTYVESNPVASATGSSEIKETQVSAATYATMRKTISFSDMEKFFSDTYGAVGKEAGQRIAGNAMALYYSWDEKNMKSDVAAGFPVTGSEAVKGANMVSIPQSNAYMAVHKGGYSSSMAVHDALGKKIDSDGKKLDVVMEDYVVGPATEKDSTKWVTNIYYIYK